MALASGKRQDERIFGEMTWFALLYHGSFRRSRWRSPRHPARLARHVRHARGHVAASIGCWLVLALVASWNERVERDAALKHWSADAQPVPKRDLNALITDPHERGIYGLPTLPSRPVSPGAEPPGLNDVLKRKA